MIIIHYELMYNFYVIFHLSLFWDSIIIKVALNHNYFYFLEVNILLMGKLQILREAFHNQEHFFKVENFIKIIIINHLHHQDQN